MRAMRYFIYSLVAVVVLGFTYSRIGAFVRSGADKMGGNQKKKAGEIEPCQKKRSS
jgi:hypothetical protein